MKLLGLLLFIPFLFIVSKGSSQIIIEPGTLDFGTIEEAGYVKSYLVIRNTSSKPLMLLRVDAPKGFTVTAGRKAVPPNDTVHLSIEVRPKKSGRFSENIRLFHNGSNDALTFRVKGELKTLLTNDLTSCVSFDPKTGKTGSGNLMIPVITNHTARFADSKTGEPIREAAILFISTLSNEKLERTTTSGKLVSAIPIGPYALVVTSPGFETYLAEQYIAYNAPNQTFMLVRQKVLPKPDTLPDPAIPLAENPAIPLIAANSELDESLFKPNNIVFLIDVSGSMKDPDKLPLLKKSIKRLMIPIRDIDKVTIVAYSTESKVIVPTVTGSDKEKLVAVVDTLKAEGVTAGSKGIQMAYEIAKEQFIPGGNNQVILATDGVFRLSSKDRKMISNSAAAPDQKLVLSVISFGDDEPALNMLEGLATIGGGSMIKTNTKVEAEKALLEEVKMRSRR